MGRKERAQEELLHHGGVFKEREDLVVIFFTKVDFEYHDYKVLHH